jgi:transcription antitermination factor NusG
MMLVSPWFVVCTAPNAERIAKLQFEREGIETFLPLRELPPTTGKLVNVQPLWAGYLFVKAQSIPERAYAARHFIRTPEGWPVQVPTGVVERWIDIADADGLVDHYTAPAKPHYAPGDIVRVLSGFYVGGFGRVEKQFGQCVKTELSWLGNQKVVTMRLEQVALADFGAIASQEEPARNLAPRGSAKYAASHKYLHISP